MIVGGSTTSLLSLMNSLDPQKYDIDLQLYKNEGPLLDALPKHVNLLSKAEKYSGVTGKIGKLLKFIFKGYALKAVVRSLKNGNLGVSRAVLGDCKAKEFSKKNNKHYDYAIGFLEGWSDRYLAWGVDADNKYAWLHSTFDNITKDPDAERSWMNLVDKIVFVADACLESFVNRMPDMSSKCLTIENITDDDYIIGRAECIDESDDKYIAFSSFNGMKIITVCRVDIETKGLDRVIQCADRMKKIGKSFLWYIVGDGEQYELFKSKVCDAGLSDVLVPIGRRMNPYTFINISDVMCMLSRYEGKPMVVTESLILNVPVVVTEYLSAHNQIKQGVEGVIVANDDSSIVENVVSHLLNSEQLLQMREYVSSNTYGNKEYIKVIEKELFTLKGE